MSIGAELRVAFAAMAKPNSGPVQDTFGLRKCWELCLRPAIEPLLLAHWTKLKTFQMTEGELGDLCSLLCGGAKQTRRTRPSYGLWYGGDVEFEPIERARTWWLDIQAVAGARELRLLLPAFAFARTIIAHPFSDGNGRIARALVHASLAREHRLSAPVLPLAPAFYMNGAKLAAGLRELSASGDWNQFDRVFWQVLEHASVLSRRG